MAGINAMPTLPRPLRSNNFRNQLESFTIIPKCLQLKVFIDTEALRSWLKQCSPNGQDTNIAILVNDAYQSATNVAHLVSVDDTIKRCLFTFCILLELNRGHQLHFFTDAGILDEKLRSPLELKVLREKIRLALNHSGTWHDKTQQTLDDLTTAFYELHWKYFPAKFDYQIHLDVERQTRLPFIDRRTITKKGGFAVVYEVAIPESFVGDELKNKSAPPIKHPDFPKLGRVYRYALKVFEEVNFKLFQQEVDAYKTLGPTSGIVKYLGTFSQPENVDGRDNPIRMHSIFLEYAETDLSEYFHRSRPVTAEQIESSWSKLFGIVPAIAKVHEGEFSSILISSETTKYEGSHSDIKPDNILLVGDEFKLADPGFAVFESLESKDRTKRRAQILGGTSTYGPPEHYSKSFESTKSRQGDMWALGCVLSEFATWILLGYRGCRAFSDYRQRAVSEFLERPQSSECARTDASMRFAKNLRNRDCFHDGEKVLERITAWHVFLKSHLSPHDTMTKHILDMVQHHLLIIDDSRWTASRLQAWWSQIRLRSSPTSETTTPSLILDVLDSTMKGEAEGIISHLEWLSTEDRRAAKNSQFFPFGSRSIVPNKTTIVYEPPANMEKHIRSPTTQTSKHENGRLINRPHVRIPSMSLPQRTSDEKLTIFDAFYKLNEETHKPKSSLFSALAKKQKEDKDQRLERHCVDRDLIYLIDNGDTMQEHWSAVTFLLDIMVSMTWNIAAKGIEVKFCHGAATINGKSYQDRRHSERKRRILEDVHRRMAEPNTKPTTGRTDISVKLGEILDKWLIDFQNSRRLYRQQNNLTIYVMTDGLWMGMLKPDGVDDVIKNFHSALDKVTKFQTKRRVSIQFISFGDDSRAIDRLEHLDDTLGDDVPDIVDTEPLTGDVYQMLLGSMNDDYDGKNGDPASQLSPQKHFSPLSEDEQTSGVRTPSRDRSYSQSNSGKLWASPDHY